MAVRDTIAESVAAFANADVRPAPDRCREDDANAGTRLRAILDERDPRSLFLMSAEAA